jgi:hypothetical protein
MDEGRAEMRRQKLEADRMEEARLKAEEDSIEVVECPGREGAVRNRRRS